VKSMIDTVYEYLFPPQEPRMAYQLNDAAFASFAFFSAILGFKLAFMAPLTAINRFRKKAFANPEDLPDPKLKVKTDEDVERVRRAHLNDLENILPFFFVGFLYCFTNPDPDTANLLFKVFTVARIFHTFCYAVKPLPQPSRALSFFVGLLVQIYMLVKVVSYFS